MLSPAGLSNKQGDLERALVCVVEKEREAHQNDDAPKSGCLIHVPDHEPHFYADLTPWAARAAAKQSGAKDRLKFSGRG